MVHKPINMSAQPDAKDQMFQAINTIMGHLKRYLFGIHHAMRAGNIARYLAAFAWRFNHRYNIKHAFKAGVNCIRTTQPLTIKSLRDVLYT